MPKRFCIKIGIYDPFIIRASKIRIKKHKNLRKLTISVKDILRWVRSNVNKPIKIIQKNK